MSLFETICVASGLQEPVAEFCFAPPRKFRFDWAWPESKIALEIEGGVWQVGRHQRPKGFVADLSKYNEAAILGWTVLRVTSEQFNSGEAVLLVKRAKEAKCSS